jgi:hypothetical protein
MKNRTNILIVNYPKQDNNPIIIAAAIVTVILAIPTIVSWCLTLIK